MSVYRTDWDQTKAHTGEKRTNDLDTRRVDEENSITRSQGLCVMDVRRDVGRSLQKRFVGVRLRNPALRVEEGIEKLVGVLLSIRAERILDRRDVGVHDAPTGPFSPSVAGNVFWPTARSPEKDERQNCKRCAEPRIYRVVIPKDGGRHGDAHGNPEKHGARDRNQRE